MDEHAQQKADQLGFEFFHYGKEGKILKLIPEAMRLIGGITKLRKRKIFGGDGGGEGGGASFAFRGIDDALNGVGPILAKLGITPSIQLLALPRYEMLNATNAKTGKPQVVNRADVALAVTYLADDGSWVRNSAAGMSTDTNDNTASNKAHSAAAKYAIFLGLHIPVDRQAMEDGDEEEGEGPASFVEQAGSAVRSSTRPGDDKSEEMTQAALVALKDALSAKDTKKIAEIMTAASNNSKFSESQRATIVKTGKDYIGTLNKPKTGATQQPTGQRPPQGAATSRPAATRPPQQQRKEG